MELSLIDLIRLLLLCVMCVSIGLTFEVDEKDRNIAKVIWAISIIMIFVFSMY